MASSNNSDDTNNSAEITDLKTKRSSAKRNITRLINKINPALNDPGGVSAVEETFAALTTAFEHFCDVHQEYHELIEEEDDVDISSVILKKLNVNL